MSSLDPRIRLILGLLIMALVLSTGSLSLLAGELAGLSLGVLSLGMLDPFLTSLRVSGPMVAMVFLIGVASFPPEQAIGMALRFQALLTASYLLFKSLTAEELGGAMRRLGVPYPFSFIVITAMRYVPLLGRRIHAIMEAQRSRGIDLRPRIRNLRNLAALLVPLLLQSFRLAEDLALAMEARGFSRPGRTMRGRWRVPLWQYGLVLVFTAMVAAVVWMG